MSYNYNLHSNIQQHLGAHLPSERSVGFGAYLLRSKLQSTASNNASNVL